jgi:ABC-2 type transport system permease protein
MTHIQRQRPTPNEDLIQPVPAVTPLRSVALPLPRRIDFSALWTLFVLTLRQHWRGRRLLLLSFLFLIPSGLAVLFHLFAPGPPRPREMELGLILLLLPHALAPLAALLYATGMIQDEVEEQTLTYLLVRPIPRKALYLTKLLATWLLTALLAGVFTLVAFLAVYGREPGTWPDVLVHRALPVTAALALALAVYCTLFGFLSLYTRWALVVGIAYILLFEGILANIPFAVRKLTVMYYFRVLVSHWLDLSTAPWQLKLGTAPTALSAALMLLGVAAVAALLAALLFSNREFRVKTPE